MTQTPAQHLDELITGCRVALAEETDAVRADLGRRGLDGPITVTGGVRTTSRSAGQLYDWKLPPGRFGIRADDAVAVESEAGSGLGFVVRFDGDAGVVRIATDASLGPSPGMGTLLFDPTWLLEALDERLADVGQRPGLYHVTTALKLFGRVFPAVADGPPPLADTELNASQRSALGRVQASDTQFVWGPPGTGKTRLLGHAAALLASEGSVLVVAPTNAAVDEAASRVAGILGLEAIEANRLIRFGAGQAPGSDPVLGVDAAVSRAERLRPGPPTRTLEELAERLGRRLEIGDSLGAAAAPLIAAARRTAEPALSSLAGRFGSAYQLAARQALGSADVVLATLARLAVREELWTLRFDSLLIDEASAATQPYVLLAACLARRRAAVFGDFQQLPAVVQSRGPMAAQWMRRDIFRASGVLDSPDGLPSPRDGLCSMLDEQYRMRPAIRALIGDLFYGGRLRDGTAAGDGPGQVVLVDTTPLEPRVDRADRSRRNDQHLEVLLQTLELLGRQGVTDVAVVAPYRIQVRELRRLARSRLGRAAPAKLEIATIHRFQGREKRVVVFDTVDAPPGASWFLDERRNPDFPRLLNVALSRSRDMLVLVATVQGLRRTLPEDALLNRVIERVSADGLVMDGRHLTALPIPSVSATGSPVSQGDYG